MMMMRCDAMRCDATQGPVARLEGCSPSQARAAGPGPGRGGLAKSHACVAVSRPACVHAGDLKYLICCEAGNRLPSHLCPWMMLLFAGQVLTG